MQDPRGCDMACKATWQSHAGPHGRLPVVCEDIAAPYEQAEVAALRAAGLQVRTVWLSSLLPPSLMPWSVDQLPGVFTTFRQKVESADITPAAPLPAPTRLLPPPDVSASVLQAVGAGQGAAAIRQPASPQGTDARSSFPYGTVACDGSEAAALAHLAQYLARKLPHGYKATRNGLTGLHYSSKFSPWLATGALSRRQVMPWPRLKAGSKASTVPARAPTGSGSSCCGATIFGCCTCSTGQHPVPCARPLRATSRWRPHNAAGLRRAGAAGDTGQPLVDAALRELAATGYLSNRLRQVAASYLHPRPAGRLARGRRLVSNRNWWTTTRTATRATGSTSPGAAPTRVAGRRFNPAKQTQDHDADGSYRRLWGTA